MVFPAKNKKPNSDGTVLPKEPLSPHLIQFIRISVKSVEQAEVLLLLRQEASRTWSAQQVAMRLHYHPVSVAERLEDLRIRGLCTLVNPRERSYQYRPATTWDESVSQLDDAYRLRRDAVISAIIEGGSK